VGEEDNAADFDKAPLRGFDFDFCHGGVATMGVWSELGTSLNRLRGELTVGDDVRVDVVVSQLVNLEIRLAMFVGSLNIPLKVALCLRVFHAGIHIFQHQVKMEHSELLWYWQIAT
jgi:hypothetical protein